MQRIITIVLGFLLVAAAMYAGGQSSVHYRIPRDVLAGGGRSASSASYASQGTLGQPGVVGDSDSFSYVVFHGFWGPVVLLATPTPGPATPTPSPTVAPTATPPPSPSPTVTASPTPDWGMVGDIDDDGRITTADALLCFQIALGMYIPTPEEEYRGDADQDGRVTTADALCIFQEALGIPNFCFPLVYLDSSILNGSFGV